MSFATRLGTAVPRTGREPSSRLQRLPPAFCIAGCVFTSALASVLLFSPRFFLWRALGIPPERVELLPEFHRAYFALQQLANPWQHIDDATNRVIEWRLFWPVVAHYLHVPIAAYLAVPMLGSLLALSLVAAITWRETQAPVAALYSTMLAATSSWYFVSMGWLAYFDSWLIAALLAASFSESRRTLLATALVAPWIDERFILALPACIAVRAVSLRGRSTFAWSGWRGDVAALGAGVMPYLLFRLGAESLHARDTARNYLSGRRLVGATPLGLAEGIWEGLRLGWVAVAYLVLAAPPRWRIPVVLALTLTLFVTLSVVDDLSRSASIVTPALLAGVIASWKRNAGWPRRLLPLLAAGNLLLPARHIIAAPTNPDAPIQRVPIFYLYSELDRWREPPGYGLIAGYNERAQAAYRQGDMDRALRELDVALQISPHFARGRANRGVILFVSGKQTEGIAELERALRDDPTMNVVRLDLARCQQQTGALAAALTTVEEAQRRALAGSAESDTARQLQQSLRSALLPGRPDTPQRR